MRLDSSPYELRPHLRWHNHFATIINFLSFIAMSRINEKEIGGREGWREGGRNGEREGGKERERER